MGSLCASTNARVPVVSPLFLTPSYLLHSSRDDVADDGGGICFRWVSLDVSLTGRTEVTKDEVQVLLGHEQYRAHDAVLCDDWGRQCVLGFEDRQHRAKYLSHLHSIVRMSSTGSAAVGIRRAAGPVVVTGSLRSVLVSSSVTNRFFGDRTFAARMDRADRQARIRVGE